MIPTLIRSPDPESDDPPSDDAPLDPQAAKPNTIVSAKMAARTFLFI